MALAPVLLDEQSTAEKAREVGEVNDRLAGVTTVPHEVGETVDDLVRELLAMPESDAAQMDPYLLLALQRGVLAATRALHLPRVEDQRRNLRIALEQIRQSLRDFSEARSTLEETPAKDVARWLVDTVSVPQATWAELIGTTPRTFQRWISLVDPTRPQGEEERRLRVIARMVNHLRHAFTGPGVVAWLQQPSDDLRGAAPVALLDRPDAIKQLVTLAARARSFGAA